MNYSLSEYTNKQFDKHLNNAVPIFTVLSLVVKVVKVVAKDKSCAWYARYYMSLAYV